MSDCNQNNDNKAGIAMTTPLTLYRQAEDYFFRGISSAVYDFDDIEVPKGADKKWRQESTDFLS